MRSAGGAVPTYKSHHYKTSQQFNSGINLTRLRFNVRSVIGTSLTLVFRSTKWALYIRIALMAADRKLSFIHQLNGRSIVRGD